MAAKKSKKVLAVETSDLNSAGEYNFSFSDGSAARFKYLEGVGFAASIFDVNGDQYKAVQAAVPSETFVLRLSK